MLWCVCVKGACRTAMRRTRLFFRSSRPPHPFLAKQQTQRNFIECIPSVGLSQVLLHELNKITQGWHAVLVHAQKIYVASFLFLVLACCLLPPTQNPTLSAFFFQTQIHVLAFLAGSPSRSLPDANLRYCFQTFTHAHCSLSLPPKNPHT